jgi:hypothetical protein
MRTLSCMSVGSAASVDGVRGLRFNHPSPTVGLALGTTTSLMTQTK